MPCQRSAGIARLPLSLEPCGSLAVPQARLDRNRQGRGREGGCLTDHKVCRRGLAEFLRARCLNSGRIHPPLAKSGLAQAKGQKGIVGMGGGETRREEAAMAAMPDRHCLVKQLSCCRRLLGPEWKGRQRERKEPQSSDGLIRTEGGREGGCILPPPPPNAPPLCKSTFQHQGAWWYRGYGMGGGRNLEGR